MCNSTSGPNENYKTAICNQSGKWEPNPRQGCKTTSNLGCDLKGVIYILTSIDYQTVFVQKIPMQHSTGTIITL